MIYDDDEQRKKIIGQFLAKGISIGEQGGYFTDTTTLEDVDTWLKEESSGENTGVAKG